MSQLWLIVVTVALIWPVYALSSGLYLACVRALKWIAGGRGRPKK